jgi:choline dehydrogenase-like flavoprotein
MTSLWLAQRDTHPASDPLQPGVAYDVVVVGAGLTGLVSAVLLAQAGRRVAALERRYPGAVTTGTLEARLKFLHVGENAFAPTSLRPNSSHTCMRKEPLAVSTSRRYTLAVSSESPSTRKTKPTARSRIPQRTVRRRISTAKVSRLTGAVHPRHRADTTGPRPTRTTGRRYPP